MYKRHLLKPVRPVFAYFIGMSLLSASCSRAVYASDNPAPAPDSHAQVQQQLNGMHLDLSSTEALIQANNQAPVQIQVGGQHDGAGVSGGSSLTVNPGQLLTAAQYFALNQVLQGPQTILIGAEGQALGGYSVIQASTLSQLQSLHVPENVSLAAVGYNASAPLNVSGNVNLAGSLYSLQQSAGIGSVLNLGNLNVGSGALLSGHLPTAFNLGPELFASGSLTINVLNNVLNMGTISSPGDLNIYAGGNISNQSIAGAGAASLFAGGNLNLFAASGQFVNNALITANGNLNISTLLNKDLSLQNTGGVLEALSGSINLRDSLFSGKQFMSISGGDFLSRELNIYNGNGFAAVDLGQVAGVLNVETGSIHLGAKSSELNIGNFTVTGDPVIYNQGGGVTIGNTTLASADLVLLAQGTVTAGNIVLNSAAGQRSGNLTVVGGANFTVANAAASPPQQSLNGTAAAANTSFEITGASGLAGTVQIGSIDTRATAGGSGVGGNINIVSFNGNVTTTGITSGGLGAAGSNGSVTIYTPGNISTGSINTSGSTNAAASGSISIMSAAPLMVDAGGAAANVTITPTNPGVNDFWTVSNRFVPDYAKITAASNVSVGALTVNGADISVVSGNNITLAGAVSASRTGAGLSGNGGNIELIAGARQSGTAGGGSFTAALPAISANAIAGIAGTAAKGGNITIASGTTTQLTLAGAISANGAVSGASAAAGSGGNINIIGARNIVQNTGITISALGASASGNGGDVFIASGANYNLKSAANTFGNMLQLTGASGTAGGYSAVGTAGINTRPNTAGANAAGGNLQIASFDGLVSIANAANIQMAGRGSGQDGNLTILSSAAANAVTVTAGNLGTNTGAGAGTGGKGNIVIATATPYSTAIDLNPASGLRSSQLSLNLASLVNTGNINLRGLSSNGGKIQAIAGGNLILNNVVVNANRVGVTGSGGNIELAAGARTAGIAGAGVITGLNASANGVATVAGQSALGGNITAVSGTGNMTITGNVSANGAVNGAAASAGNGGNINVVSAGSITQAGTTSANGFSSTGAGGNIFFSSGTNYILSAAANSLGNTVEISGASGTAGTMTLNGGFQARPSTAGANAAGGTLQLGAFAGGITIANGANISLQGRGNAADGQLTILSNLSGGNAVSVTAGSIGTNTGTNAGLVGKGDITIATAVPYTSTISINPESGTRSAGLSFDLANIVSDGNLNLRGLSSNGGNIRVIAGGNLTLNNAVINANRALATGNGGNIELIAGARTTGAAGSGTITGLTASANGFATAGQSATGGNIIAASGSGAALTITGNVTANGAVSGAAASAGNGGNINIISAAGITQAGTTAANGLSLTGKGGNIFLSSGTNYILSAAANSLGNTVEISGASGTAGTMTLNGGFQAMSTTAGANASGGNLQIGAFGGGITINNGALINLQGRGNGSDGQLTILSNLSGGTAVSVNGGSIGTNTGTSAGLAGKGDITIATATPYTSTISINPESGTRSAGLSFDLANIVNNGNLNLRGLSSNGGNIRVIAGGNLTLNNGLINANRALATGNGGNVELIAGARTAGAAGGGNITGLAASANGFATAGQSATGGNITAASGSGAAMTITGNLTANGAVSGAAATAGNGGNINIISAAGITQAGTTSANGLSLTGAGGNIFFSSGTNYILSAAANSFGNTVEISGPSGTAGTMTLNGLFQALATTAGANAAGGTLQLGAFGGGITIANGANISLQGRGNAADGQLTILSDRSGGNAVSVTTGSLGTNTGTTAGLTGKGDITIATATPYTSAITVNPATGSCSAGLSFNLANIVNDGNLNLRGLSSNGGNIRVIAGGNLTLNNGLINANRALATGNGGNIELIAGARTAGSAGIGNITGLTASSNGFATAGQSGTGGNITAASGSGAALTITANVSAGGAVSGAAVTAGNGGNINIISAAGITQTGTTSANGLSLTGAGGSIFFSSGTNYILSAAANSLGNTIELTGPSGTAGTMTLNGSFQARPSTVGANAAGGSLQLGAFGGGITIANGANISLQGRGNAADGQLTILSSLSGGNAVSVTAGSIGTNTGTNAGLVGKGDITVATATPFTTAISINPQNGARSSALSFVPANIVNDGNLNLRGLSSNGGNIRAIAGGNLTLNNGLINANRALATGNGGNIELVAGARSSGSAGSGIITGLSASANAAAVTAATSGSGGNITVASGSGGVLTVSNNISANGAVNGAAATAGNGGSINIVGAAGITQSGTTAANGLSSTGAGGKILFSSGTNYNLASAANAFGNSLQLTGASASPGAMAINGTLQTVPSTVGAIASGGTIQLGAFGGGITIANGANLQVQGRGTGSDGNLTILSSLSGGNAVSVTTGVLSTALGTGAGTGGGGALTVASALPFTGSLLIDPGTGASGSALAYDLINVTGGDLLLRGLSTNGGNITAVAGRNIAFNSTSALASRTSGTGSGGRVNIFSSVTDASGVISNLINVRSDGLVSTPLGSADGGCIVIASRTALNIGGDLTANGASAGALPPAGGSGGTIALASGAGISITGQVRASGAANIGSGGSITIAGGNQYSLSSSSLVIGSQNTGIAAPISIGGIVDSRAGAGSNGNGGLAQIGAFGTPGSITALSGIFAGGSGTGANGEIIAIAEGPLNLGPLNVSGGSGGAGSILTAANTAPLRGPQTVAINCSTCATSGRFGAPLLPPAPLPAQQITLADNKGISFAIGTPSLLNTGVPTDRIFYAVDLTQGIPGGQQLVLSDRRSWFVASGPGQPYVLEGDNDTFVLGQEGSRLALVETRTLALDSGRVAVLVGSKADLAIETAFGVLNIPAGAVALIDSTSPDGLSVINMSAQPLQFYLQADGKARSFSLQGSEELLLSSGLSNFSPSDGFSRKALPFKADGLGSLRLSKNSINRMQVLEKERLFACGENENCMSKKRVDALKLQAQESSESDEAVFSPIAFKSSNKVAANGLTVLNTASAQIKHTGADLGLSGGKIELRKGEILLIAHKPTLVVTGDSSVMVAGGSIALVSKDEAAVRVRTVWEARSGTVKQILGKSHVTVGAGEESILAKNDGAIAFAHKNDYIGRRRVRQHELENKRVSTSEIALITLLADSPVLKAISASPDPADKSLKARVLKMAACIQAVTGAHGNYTSMRDKN